MNNALTYIGKIQIQIRFNHQSDAPRPNSPFPRSNAFSSSSLSLFYPLHAFVILVSKRASPSLSLALDSFGGLHTPPRGSIQTRWLSCRYSARRASPEKALTKPRQRGGCSPFCATTIIRRDAATTTRAGKDNEREASRESMPARN